MQNLADFKHTFDQSFEQLVAQKIAQAIGYTNNTDTAVFLSYIQQYIKGGKRFRPYAVQQSYMLAGGAAPITEVLAAVELLHIFALIHDDIMDKAVSRHGIASAHLFIAEQYEQKHATQSAHHGNSQAILLGDLAFSWATELFFNTVHTVDFATRAAQATVDYAELTKEVIVGQMLDAHLAALASVPAGAAASLDDIAIKNKLKTAHYSFAWPLVIGNTLAGGSIARRDALMQFGTALGLAFQAQDDVLDVTMSDTGKSKCSDIEQGQQTILSGYIFNHGTEAQKETLRGWQGTILSEEQKHDACVFMQESGAIAYAQQYTQEQLAIAKDTITNQLPNEASVWLSLITEIQQRSK